MQKGWATVTSGERASDAGIAWQRPSPRLLRARRLQTALATVPAALAVGVILGIAVSPAAGLGAGPGLVAIGAAWERFLARRVAAWGYAERNDDLMVRRGVLVRRQSVIPYGRMQFVDMTAGPVERSLGLRPCACTRPRRPVTRASPVWTGRWPLSSAISSPRSARPRQPGCDGLAVRPPA